MSLSDPIADMLTRIRNAHMASLDVVEMQHSGIKENIARVLKREGYITDYVTERRPQKYLRVYLKYTDEREPAILGLKRDSRPGCRHYVSASDVPKVLRGIGTAILSTSSGVLTDKEARKMNIGGELLCSVW